MAERKAKFSREYRVFLRLLRAERERAGITQAALAKKLKVAQTFISKCERGERRLDIIETRRFCLAMGIYYPNFVEKLEIAIAQPGSIKTS